MDNIFDLYTDYLQVSLGLAAATGLSKLMDNFVSHDQVTRMLAKTKHIGINRVPCICASIIGGCLVLVGTYQSVIWLFSVLFILGIANGLQNTFMATFMMKVIPASKRQVLMPIYMMIVQVSVLFGFFIAGLFPVKYSSTLLIVAGSCAFLAGIFGYCLNCRHILFNNEIDNQASD